MPLVLVVELVLGILAMDVAPAICREQVAVRLQWQRRYRDDAIIIDGVDELKHDDGDAQEHAPTRVQEPLLVDGLHAGPVGLRVAARRRRDAANGRAEESIHDDVEGTRLRSATSSPGRAVPSRNRRRWAP